MKSKIKKKKKKKLTNDLDSSSFGQIKKFYFNFGKINKVFVSEKLVTFR
jgi:hypothetical protein